MPQKYFLLSTGPLSITTEISLNTAPRILSAFHDSIWLFYLPIHAIFVGAKKCSIQEFSDDNFAFRSENDDGSFEHSLIAISDSQTSQLGLLADPHVKFLETCIWVRQLTISIIVEIFYMILPPKLKKDTGLAFSLLPTKASYETYGIKFEATKCTLLTATSIYT